MRWPPLTPLALVAALALGLAPCAAAAGHAPAAGPSHTRAVEPPVEGYNGTAFGVALGPAVHWLAGQVRAGGTVRAHLSLVLQLLDVAAHCTGTAEPAAFGSPAWSGGLALRLHPLFPVVVRQRMRDFIAAGAYLEVGGHVAHAAGTWGAGPSLGAGVDVPLGRPQGGHSWWLGASYAHRWDLHGPWSHDAVTVVVEIRWHGLRWGHLPRPTEFDFSPLAQPTTPSARRGPSSFAR